MRELERSAVAGVRQCLRRLGVTIAETDRNFKYRWVENPHSDFHDGVIVGKRDDEFLPAAEAAEMLGLKRQVLETELPASRIICFNFSDGLRCYEIQAYPVRSNGWVDGVLLAGFDIPKDAAPLTKRWLMRVHDAEREPGPAVLPLADRELSPDLPPGGACPRVQRLRRSGTWTHATPTAGKERQPLSAASSAPAVASAATASGNVLTFSPRHDAPHLPNQ